MRMVDFQCQACGRVFETLVRGEEAVACTCGSETLERIYRTSTRAVWQDSIEGGIEIAHGLCNEDGTPRTYYSKSEIALECQKRNLIQWGHIWEESRTKDARVHDDWLQSGEARRARAERVEQRREKAARR